MIYISNFFGNINYDDNSNTGLALRPVVSLNSEITVNATDAE